MNTPLKVILLDSWKGFPFMNVVYTCLLKDLPRLRPEFEKTLSTLKTADLVKAAAAAKP